MENEFARLVLEAELLKLRCRLEGVLVENKLKEMNEKGYGMIKFDVGAFEELERAVEFALNQYLTTR